MSLTEMVIHPPEKKGREGKGRAFRALCLTATCADSLWDKGKGGSPKDTIERPVYATFLGSDAEMRHFAANLQLGHPVTVIGSHRSRDSGYEFLRSVPYRYSWQRETEGTALTIYLPELFQRDAGMVDPEHVRFVMMPTKAWEAAQTGIDIDAIARFALRLPMVRAMNKPPTDERGFRQTDRAEFTPRMPLEWLRTLVVPAYLFAMYLDRRTRAPIPADGRFYLQLYLACLRDNLATWPTDKNRSYYNSADRFGFHPGHRFRSEGYEIAGFSTPVAFNATHDDVETLFAKEAVLFFDLTGGN